MIGKRGVKGRALLLAGALTMAGCLTCFAEYTDQETVMAVQQALNEAGYDCGTPDGKIGNMTRSAISAYQEASGLAVTGTIEDEMLTAMGLADASGQQDAAQEIPAESMEINNETAWDQLYAYLSENGSDIDGMKGIQKIAEDHTTYIAVAEGDTENIYFATKTDSDEIVRTGLTFAVKKNDAIAEFRADDNINSEGYEEFDIYIDTHAYGHVDISTLTSKTVLTAERCERETKDIHGNVTNSSDLSNFHGDGTTMHCKYELLSDIPEILTAYGLDISLNDLGFYVNLDKLYNIELGEHETVKNIVGDVYAVIPDDWSCTTKSDIITNYYPPENIDQVNSNLLMISTNELETTGGLGAYSRGEEREPLLEATLNAFRKEGFTMTDEQTGIDVAGFQARKAQVVWHESTGDSDMKLVSFLVDGDKLDDYSIMIGYKVARENETDHSDVYQRLLDTIYVDTDGSYTARLTGVDEPAEEAVKEEEGGEAAEKTASDLQSAMADLSSALSGEASETADQPAAAADPNAVPATVSQTDTSAEITYNEPFVILDDELVTISIEGVKYDGEKAWYYYSIKNNSADTYVNEFFQSEAFGDYMFNYSSYTPEGSSGAVPPGKNSGRRGKGAVSAHVNSLADLQTFSGAVKIYPSDNPDSYSSEGSYSASFSITADLGEYEGTQEQAEPAPEGIEVNETDEYAEIIYHTPAVLVDDENVTVTLDSVKLVFGDRVWFYYSLLNKGERYVNEFFDGVSFGDYMVDFSSYTSEGSGDSVPAGKNSGSRGKGSTDITNVSSLEDLKNFSGSVKLYFGDEPGSYSSDGSYSVPFEVHYDALAGSDAQAAEAQTETAQAAEVQAETEAAAGDEAMITEDEIRQLLVGSWNLGEGGSVDFTEEAAKITLNGHPLDGTYAINTEEKQIDVSFTVESKNVTIHLPYTCADGVFTLYNNRGGEIGTVSMDTQAATEQAEAAAEQAATEQAQAVEEEAAEKQAEETGAQQSSGISAEELEAQLREQPVYVDSVEVLDSGDSRFYDYNMGYRNCNFVLPHIVNQSEDDIKDLQIWTFGWDNNNLPVTVEYNGTRTNDVMFSEVSLIPGGVTNQYDAEMLNFIPTGYECKKAKCLVAGYRTYSGETWTNPLSTDWVKCYKDQKLVEPVYYTDAETVQKVQTALNEAGYDCGTPDGIAGSKTYEALHQYQEANGLTVQDHITDALLQSMGIQ